MSCNRVKSNEIRTYYAAFLGSTMPMMAMSTGQNDVNCLEGSDRPPAQLCRHGAGRSMCKTLKKQILTVIHFSRIFLYFDLHAGLTLDVFPYSDTYGSERLVTFTRVIGTPRIVYRPERLPLKTTRQEGRQRHRQNHIAKCLCGA